MNEIPKAEQDLVFRNVQLHSRGRKEHGSLHLTRHHLFFRYYPNTTKADTKKPSGQGSIPQVTPEGSRSEARARTLDVATSSALSASSEGGSEINGRAGSPLPKDHTSASGVSRVNGPDIENNANRPRQRPVDMWVPYPLVNSCILRPGHSIRQVGGNPGSDMQAKAAREDDELFPPVFGTASSTRPSTDSARLAPYTSPQRPSSPTTNGVETVMSNESGRQPAIRIRLRDFRMMALHFSPSQAGISQEETAREVFFILRKRCCVQGVENFHAFHFRSPKEEILADSVEYDARREYARMGISDKAADGPGTAWRITDINRDYSYSATYPNVLCVPRTVSDNMLKYGGAFRSRFRIPCLAYLHSNGGSITRSAQPMVGLQSRRNPQDERLVSAIFSSHTPPLQSAEDLQPELQSLTSLSSTMLESISTDPAAVDTDVPNLPVSHSETALNETSEKKETTFRKKVYGSTRQNFIADARPKMNALANRATGGGIEDVANYQGNSEMPVTKVFLNIGNIHVMRASLDKVIEALANSDYAKMKPDQEALRKSAWLSHITGMLEGAEMVARVVGLGGSHVLVHCSDGWDRTAQVSALAQVMLDPHARTLSGFISLVQKDFLSFGHKFRDRNGIGGSEKWFEIENERIAPSRKPEANSSEQAGFNKIGAKAITGARNWFEKNRSSLFRQQNDGGDNMADQASSRPSTPPPNPVLHSPPNSTGKEEKEHKISEKEISPVFHQFMDAVFQLQNQNSNVFEFNERFLRRLFYHTYSCQYGEFLFNCEKERAQHKGKLASVWSHFLSRRREFTNPEYVAKVEDPLLFPKRLSPGREIDTRWWNKLFGRDDEEMNVPRALAPPDPPNTAEAPSLSASFDERSAGGSEEGEPDAPSNGPIHAASSTPTLNTLRDSLSNSFSSLSIRAIGPREDAVESTTLSRPTESESAAHNAISSPPQPEAGNAGLESKTQAEPVAVEYDGDPLGVTTSMSKMSKKSGLDSTAFASQNALRDR